MMMLSRKTKAALMQKGHDSSATASLASSDCDSTASGSDDEEQERPTRMVDDRKDGGNLKKRIVPSLRRSNSSIKIELWVYYRSLSVFIQYILSICQWKLIQVSGVLNT